jgi:hypothetical protein
VRNASYALNGESLWQTVYEHLGTSSSYNSSFTAGAIFLPSHESNIKSFGGELVLASLNWSCDFDFDSDDASLSPVAICC